MEKADGKGKDNIISQSAAMFWEKKVFFSICEVYPTVQGEGFLIGSPVTLVRFQGCNIYCSWCDTKYAIPFKGDVRISAEELLEKLRKIGREHLLITGGEPFAHENFGYFCRLLIEEGYFLQIETNGTLWNSELEKLPRERFYISLSPKYSVDYRIHPKFSFLADELKMVVDEHLTLEVIKREEFSSLVKGKKLILQPEGNKEKFVQKSLDLINQLLKEGLYARLIPQMHKLINLP
jgi:organic radical activating enzyme